MRPVNQISILILINVRWWNATAFYAVNIARILDQKGHRVFVGCDPGYPAFKMARQYGLTAVPLSFYGANPYKLARSFFNMWRLIRQERIEILNPHRSEDHFFALAAKAILPVAVVATRGDQRKIKKGILSRRKYELSNAVIATCDSIVAQNRSIFTAMTARVHVIYGSVDEAHFMPPPNGQTVCKSLAREFGLPTDQTIIGLVGRISRVKGQQDLIEAAAIALKHRQDLLFVIAGKEIEVTIEELRRQAESLGIADHIRFLPVVNRVERLIRAFDICVSASVNSETISRVVLEYLYLGKSVVATRVNAIGEIIVPGVNGELVPPNDHEALAAAILKLADSPELRRNYGEKSRELYQTRYNEEKFYQSYLEVLRSVTPTRRRRA